MSDEITEAVKRLKGLQEDVERLKAARDEEGEVRLLRIITEQTDVSDAVTIQTPTSVSDGTETDDTTTIQTPTTVSDGTEAADTINTRVDTVVPFRWSGSSGDGESRWNSMVWQ